MGSQSSNCIQMVLHLTTSFFFCLEILWLKLKRAKEDKIENIASTYSLKPNGPTDQLKWAQSKIFHARFAIPPILGQDLQIANPLKD